MEIALITGVSSGIGRATAVQLARHGYHIVAAGRSESRTSLVIDAIVAEGGSAEYQHLDLASLESCRIAASEFAASGREVKVLVNNAGVGVGRGLTDDGFEIHFGVNHLGHFALTNGLVQSLRRSSRVVNVTSAVHHRADGIDYSRTRQRTKSLSGIPEYAQSKLANILFTAELAKRFPEISTFAVHPGFTDTNLIPFYARPFLRRRLISPERGADSVVWCATADEPLAFSGGYIGRRQNWDPSPEAQDVGRQTELWKRSMRFIET